MEVRLIIYLNKEHIEDLDDTDLRFTTQLQRVPNIGEYFEYTSGDKTFYYGEVIKVETFKDDGKCVEHLYVTIKEFE